MDKNTTAFFNRVLGDKNTFFQDSHNNTILIGDISLDLITRKRKILCLVCKTSASEDTTREVTNDYVVFTCLNCGHRFFEHDEAAANVSSHINLNGEESKKFQSLIAAVNHDLQVGDFKVAYERCQRNKENYGRTPQMYEWGALTLFLNNTIKFWIGTSAKTVIAYLDQSRYLDTNSQTYFKIASSIATRYYQGVMTFMDITRNAGFDFSIPNDISREERESLLLEDYERNLSLRKEIFKYLRELETCYRIYPDTDFLKAGLNELYGHNGMAWYQRKFTGFLNRPQDDITGRIKLLKGYTWDFHKLESNIDFLFESENIKPSELTALLETLLRKAEPDFDFPEIRVGKIGKSPLSALASLNLFFISLIIGSVVTVGALILIGQYFPASYFVLFVFLAWLILFFVSKDKGEDRPDHLRRLINKFTNGF